MDIGAAIEKTSLWGVLHDGELRDIKTSATLQTANLLLVIEHLNGFYGWAPDAGLRFQFEGVTELRVNQWVSDPAKGSEGVRSRRWSPRQWNTLEQVVPPRAVKILEASVLRLGDGSRLELAGFDVDEEGRTTDVWLEVFVQGSKLVISTPDGVCDVDRLVQIGDAYWDNVGKKRKGRA
jgi:hypothetical protein